MTDGNVPSGEAATSDLFFGLAGILIVLVCLVSGPLRQAIGANDPTRNVSAPGEWVALADARGVVLTAPAAAPLHIALDAITTEALANWAQGAKTPLVVLAPDAIDSAFLLDSALAAAGVAEVRRLRLDAPCPRPRVVPEGLVCDG